MLPDAPTTCPICGAAMSHDSQHYQALRLTARVFECGGAVCIADAGLLRPALGCPKASAIVAELRAENARLRAEWVRAGGNPEANWKDIVDWKNKQGETK